MTYRLSDFPATIFVVALGVFCALTGGDFLIPNEHYSQVTPPVLALIVVVVTTVALQMYFSPQNDGSGFAYFKTYIVKAVGIAILVGFVGFISGVVEKAPILLDRHPSCSGMDIC